MCITTELFGAISLNITLAHFCFPKLLTISSRGQTRWITNTLKTVILKSLLLSSSLRLLPLIAPLYRSSGFLNLLADSLHSLGKLLSAVVLTVSVLLLEFTGFPSQRLRRTRGLSGRRMRRKGGRVTRRLRLERGKRRRQVRWQSLAKSLGVILLEIHFYDIYIIKI
jgi:hypothetical protein